MIRPVRTRAAVLLAASMMALTACGAGAETASGGASNAVVPPTPFLVPTSPQVFTPPLVPPPVAQPVVAAVVSRPIIFTGPKAPKGKVVYLTFDDGPTRYTPNLLKVLKGYNAKATFFVIGGQVGSRPATLRAAASQGHVVGNHTWNHPTLTRLTSAQIASQLTRTNRAITKAGLPSPVCARPPYGSYNSRVKKVDDRLGLRTVLWSIDSRDWTRPGTATIARRVIKSVRNGSIVLMHDGGGNRAQSVAATRTILRTLKKQGYRFETLPACR